jgi:DNA polymerase III subunit epsilon
MLDEPLVFLDLETTGITAHHDRITEVGLVEVERGRIIGEWSTLVNPGVGIPPAIQALTGITNEMVELAPGFDEIADELWHRLEGKLVVAHNARFDYGFLRNEFRRAGMRYCSRVLCTVKLSRRLYPQHARHSLDVLLARHGIACEERHRALGDARVLWKLLQVWQREIAPETIAATLEALTRTPTVPAGLPDDIFDGIPESPGVYLFYGENDAALYVGKSINLRSRVMSHFSGDHRVGKDMKIAREVRRVDWVECGGELGALIEESRLVKSLAPVYNRRLRRVTDLCAWHWRPDEAAGAPRLISARELEIAHFGDLHGLFRSRASAIEALREIVTLSELCPIVTGLEKGRGPCFAHQLKRCRGACVGKESLASHALRLAQALAGMRMRPWPFKGRIGVRERTGARQSLIVLDRWCYVGTALSEQDLYDIQDARRQPVFDLDTYKILSRFFERPRRDCEIVELAA